MIIESQSADPAIHVLCIRIAKRIVHLFAGILMEHERPVALKETYIVLREELDKSGTPEP